MAEGRRRHVALGEGGTLMLFFGARAEEELPYFGPLMKLPRDFIDINFAFSRVPGSPKRYVQDRIRERGADRGALVGAPGTYVYVCGLKGMEDGVARAFADVCRERGIEWEALLATMREQGRYHL